MTPASGVLDVVKGLLDSIKSLTAGAKDLSEAVKTQQSMILDTVKELDSLTRRVEELEGQWGSYLAKLEGK